MHINSKAVISVLVKAVVSILILLVFLVFLDSTRKLIIFPKTKKEVRSEILTLYQSIKLGENKKQLLNSIDKFVRDNEGYKVQSQSKVVSIIPPTEIPSLTWFWTLNIFIDEQNNIVKGVAIRPIDDSGYLFCDAPKDIGEIPKIYQATHKKCI